MAMLVGLVPLTTGTFFGAGPGPNESWGRYWGWNLKGDPSADHDDRLRGHDDPHFIPRLEY